MDSFETIYCEDCKKLKQGVYSGDPSQILCKCKPENKSIHEKLDTIIDLLTNTI